MGLEQKLEEFKRQLVRMAPAGRAALYEAKTEELRANFARSGHGSQIPRRAQRVAIIVGAMGVCLAASARPFVPCFRSAQHAGSDP